MSASAWSASAWSASAWSAPALAGIQGTQLIVAGAETDVCVLQSVVSLLERGHEVFLLGDCVASSEARTRAALARMEAAGGGPACRRIAARGARSRAASGR